MIQQPDAENLHGADLWECAGEQLSGATRPYHSLPLGPSFDSQWGRQCCEKSP